MEPPTSVLPGIKEIPTTPHDELRTSVEYVRTIYHPPVRGSRRKKRDNRSLALARVHGSSQSGQSSALEEDAATGSDPTTASVTRNREGDALAELRSDAFERNYVIRWLTSVVAYLSGVLEDEEDEELEPGDSRMNEAERVKKKSVGETQSRRDTERLLADIAALLAICAGTASAGVIARIFTAHSPLLAPLALSPFTLGHAVLTSSSSPSSSRPRTNSTSSTGKDVATISVNLRDVPLDNQDYGSVGAQTWGGACVMAEMVVEDPARFGLIPLRETSSPLSPLENFGTGLIGEEHEDTQAGDKEGEMKKRPFRILELGAGTGLVSLAIASFYRALFSHDCGHGGRDVEIVVTDYYPSVLENLEVNLKSNGFGPAADEVNAVASTSNHPSSTISNVSLTSFSLDWSTFSSPPPSSPLPPPPSLSNVTPLHEPFDMAFGADIVYEEQHAVWIKGCLKKLLRKPLGAADTTGDNADEGGPRTKVDHKAYFHLIIPLRSTHTFESGTIETVFRSVLPQATGDGLRDDGGTEMDLVILEKEKIVCEVEEGGDEVVYAYYKIGWA
ncbi:hypothetical protein BKA70DRAFT_375824 [Coprinopsis sp. MPI-PUGE-AT-0042]|nr:hypothetical protein BKA70DRAFT_375824 [Coprinopsis sp. MPI-PUGE-AT-0042]